MLSGALFDGHVGAQAIDVSRPPTVDHRWVLFGEPGRIHVITLHDDELWVRRPRLVAFSDGLDCDEQSGPTRWADGVGRRAVRLSGKGAVAVGTEGPATVLTTRDDHDDVRPETVVCWSGDTVVVQTTTDGPTEPTDPDDRPPPRPFDGLAAFLGS